MPDQVPDDVKHERIERLVERRPAGRARRATGTRVGRVEEVLVEGPEPDGRFAPARAHAPQHDRQLRRDERARRASSTSASRTRPRRRFEASSWQPLQRSRDLLWDGLLNVRDLGGHPTEDGGETRLRLDHPRRQRPPAERRGWAALVDYGVADDRRPADERRARGRPARRAARRGPAHPVLRDRHGRTGKRSRPGSTRPPGRRRTCRRRRARST